ncbi:hypothetical protein EPUL_006715, partial [Erysiphe pulchra]
RVALNAADSTTTSHSNEVEDTHPYIPREHLEIFTARQRQEQAWHTRLLVCTCFLIGIDGTVSNFQEDAEKEIAKTIQLYLRSAISEFAAADTTPNVPKFFSAETIHKLSSASKANIPRKPPTVATPLKNPTEKINYMNIQASNPLPNITKNTENYWAAVARNGHKKSRTTKNFVLQITQAKKQNSQVSAGSAKKSPSGQKEKTSYPQDKSLFFRLTNNHEWQNLSPARIREIVVKKLSISPASIGMIKPVRSGFALSLCNDETRQELLKAAIRLSSFDAKLEAASNWTPVMIPT